MDPLAGNMRLGCNKYGKTSDWRMTLQKNQIECNSRLRKIMAESAKMYLQQVLALN